MARIRVAVWLAVIANVVAGLAGAAPSGTGDPVVLAAMQRINQQLAGRHARLALEQVAFYTVGRGRPLNRIHQEGFRWVANDSRRNADGANITYLVDQSDGATSNGLISQQTEAAIDRALA